MSFTVKNSRHVGYNTDRRGDPLAKVFVCARCEERVNIREQE